MTCINFGPAIVCVSNSWHRLRLKSGTHVFLDWHRYLGPTFYRDRAARREIENWYEYPAICDALDWFIGRGNRA